jgi:outer membrane protein W
MKKVFVLVIAACAYFSISAQRFDIGANLMMGLPMGDQMIGDQSEQYKGAPGFGIGGGIEANFWFNDAINIGLEAGFISFGEQANALAIFPGAAFNSTATGIPIIVKSQYYFLDDAIRPFAGIGVGYLITSRSAELNLTGDKINWDQNGLLISPRAGVMYQLTEALAVNLCVQYNLVMNSIDGELELTYDYADGTSETENIPSKMDATNYLGINIGVVYTLFD